MRPFIISAMAAAVILAGSFSLAEASNMGFKVIKPTGDSGGYVLEDADKDTEKILENNARLLERIVDLMEKSSGIVDEANSGRQQNFEDQIGELVNEWSDLSAGTPAGNYYSDHIFNFGPESVRSEGSIQIIKDDFGGLLMGDLNYDGAPTRIVVKKEASGESKIGFMVAGPSAPIARTYTFNSNARIISYIWDVAEFNSLTEGKLIFIPILYQEATSSSS